MFRLAVFATAFAVAPAAAFAGEGVCNLDASHIKGTTAFPHMGFRTATIPLPQPGTSCSPGQKPITRPQ